MKEPKAIIDLGSNTFHILIAEKVNGVGLSEIFKERSYVKLAQEGVHRIGAQPFERGLETLSRFRKQMEAYNVGHYRALGTATLRKADNAIAFIQEAKRITGIEIEVIDGQEEAQLIYEGVKQATPADDKCNLIMDIGGGSVEFMLFKGSILYWRESFPAGVALLKNRFQAREVLSNNDVLEIQQYLSDTFQPLFQALQTNKPDRLIGSSGTFEVLEDALNGNRLSDPFRALPLKSFFPIAELILNAKPADLRNISWIPKERLDLIQIAFVLMKWTLEVTDVNELALSHYAMKEGALYRLYA